MEIKSAVGNWVCIKPDNVNNKVSFGNGTQIFIDDGFNRGEYDVCSGVVVAAPEKAHVTRDWEDLKWPVITKHPNVEIPLQPGDKVWFNHNAFRNAIDNGKAIINPLKQTDWDGHKVEYIWLDCNSDFSQMEIYAYKRDGLLYGYLDNAIGEAIRTKEETTDTGIIINALEVDEPIDRLAKIVHPGTWCAPQHGATDELKVGDLVVLDEYSEVEINFDGDKKLVFLRERVLMVFDETVEIKFWKR